jgi:rod shape-determining protein MreD
MPPRGVLAQLDAGVRAGFPVAVAAILIVLSAVPVGIPGLVAGAALPCVFFWTVFRPAAMPPPAVFLLGLLQDLLGFAPIGSGVLTLLLAQGLAMRWRGWLARRSFLVVWLVFCGFAAGAATLGWMLSALLFWQLPPPVPGLLQFAVSAGLYPALAWGFSRAHRAMRQAEDAA